MEKIKILIVEDDAIVALDIQNCLKKLGYSVPVMMAYAEEAIKKVEEHNPDLVLMDIVLKGKMDGIEAAAIIRSRFDKPVIFLTAHADEKRLERAKLTMPFGYILKPFHERDLKITIEMALYAGKVAAERKQVEEQRDKLIADLQNALSEVKTLRGFLPICSHCKKIRDDKGYWNNVESYIHKHSDVEFSHSICPECMKKHYPEYVHDDE